ncbi:MAG TPA: lipopolysaccharide assembly protein LapA domain-containing protein [Ktedonobacterales bacterium]|nr:lipopolysaccharide assembly protein LapA domain-containing protein [Ktedonobacterales bacterium]
MRIIRFLIYYAMVTALGVMALLFLALNHFTIQLNLIEAQFSVSVALVIVGAAAFGFVIALLALLPGRIAAGLYARSLARDVRALGEDVRDLEYALDEEEDLRGRLLEQHEILMERHERILLRHQSLVSDHSQAVAERNDARAQLDALRIARPVASASHGSAVATALRLVPPAQAVGPSSAPAAIPQPAPVPVARIAEPAPVQHPVTPITPGPWPGVAPVAPEPAVEAAPELVPEPAPEPATVPVVSVVAAPSASVAANSPAATTPAPTPAASHVKGPGAWTRLQARARRSLQTTRARVQYASERVRQRGGKAWRAVSATASAQSKAQLARFQALQQRLTAPRNEAE